jgi:RNA polymerase sigma-70 factor, ECF subfamily
VVELDGPGAGLALVDELPLERYHLYHALHRRLDQDDSAAAAYRTAIELTDNAAEVALLRKRLAAITRPAR